MKCSIIIPTYGDRAYDLLKPCLESIFKYTDDSDCEIIVVANGCTESTRDVTRDWLFGFNRQLLWFDEALGYTRACNEGMKIAKGDYIILLNNDTILLEQPKNQWIDILLRAFWDEKMAVAGPMMQWCPWAEHDFLIGFCTMFRKSIVEELGYYDETFEAYGEDCDICVRAIQKGYKIAQVPDSEIKRSPDNPNIGLGYFPIYHAGNQSYANWPGGEELLRKNRAILHERYGTNIGKAHDCDGFMSPEELRWLAQQARKAKVVIEVGSWHGRSSRAIADNLPEDGKLYCIDTWAGSKVEQDTNHASARMDDGDHAFLEFSNNLWNHIESGRVIPLRLHGCHAAHLLKSKGVTADFIFIDGGHSKGETLTDVALFLPLIAHGGTISGHDYLSGLWPDVTMEVKDVFGRYVGNPENTTIWYTDSRGGDATCHESRSSTLVSNGASNVQPADAPKIYDCFIFNNEYSILERRLRELYDVVDRFVIVEANKTHSGKPKELNFEKWAFDKHAFTGAFMESFKPWLDKVTYIAVDDLPEVEGTITDKSWARERHQRDAIMRGLTECRDNDTIIISDVDEIPAKDAIWEFDRLGWEIASLDMELYYYDETTKAVDPWREAKVIKYDVLRQHSPCWARYQKAPTISNGGKHYSYFGGVDAIIRKIENTAHVEYDNDHYKNPERIAKAIENKSDLFDRNYVKFQ